MKKSIVQDKPEQIDFNWIRTIEFLQQKQTNNETLTFEEEEALNTYVTLKKMIFNLHVTKKKLLGLPAIEQNTFHLQSIYLSTKNTNTENNPIYKAYIPNYLALDYFKIESTYPYLLFYINDALYIHTRHYYLHDIIFKECPTVGVQKFNKEGINKYHLCREDYLIIENIGFHDKAFISNFISSCERKSAEIDGFPILCKDVELEELYDYGCFYEDTFQLVKYESLVKHNLLTEEAIINQIKSIKIAEIAKN